MAAARRRAEALLRTDPDERLAHMESPEWGFSADHLRQVNRVMDAFLDGAARGEKAGGPVSGRGRLAAPRGRTVNRRPNHPVM